ncbi:DNA replication and repair protein RecF [Iamia sp. SCSIO 61187]|uniref:DNA replication/repair protein RecF n=1 Tax=Iamia sp. SCSIO 61187 TaxID=2722752 RepID=UPI001C635251|nr:DNA replication and repair protein RecF [Iamia sp. SCSIO 61187]QYG90975.1 DNA replication and repair protein RecF [Iamia sp. SCSIO 61187]
MQLDRVWLTDFRSYASAEVALAPGLTAVVGANGQGKSNLLEAIGWMGGLRSFRAAPTEALVRVGAERAIIRGEGSRAGRALLIECEVAPGGRSRMLVNRQPVRRVRDGLDFLRAVVFAPDDLELVKGGPAERRRYLDDLVVALDPRLDAVRTDLDRILKQRSALLKQSGGRLDEAIASTLEVWNARLARAGEALADARSELVARLGPVVEEAYRDLAGGAGVVLAYDPPWRAGGLLAALAEARRDELRRGVSLVGPHRDELDITLAGLPARTHASQGEQRTTALALRLAAARLVAAELDTPPLLLLDDVLSELDDDRSAALLAHLPPGQTVITTATSLPAGTEPQLVLRVAGGEVVPA